ncbi:8198_t:CDS:2, partial [Gigaspora margarita]
MSSKVEAKTLPCLFVSFVEKYPGSDLLERITKCKPGEKQQWRNASANTATKLFTELAKYFPELTSYLDFLSSYSLCEWHYNSIVAKPSLLNQLTNKSVFLNLDESERKRLKLSNEKRFADFGAQVEPTSIDFEVQVSLPDPIYERLLGRINRLKNANRQLLAENKQLDESSNIANTNEKSLVINSYTFRESSKQWSAHKVYILQVFVPNPIGVNSNLIANVRKVLKHIKKISGVKKNSRALYKEMNMLKAFVELNWDIDIKDFAQCQGYRTENQLQFFKKCSDHHKSWDSIYDGEQMLRLRPEIYNLIQERIVTSRSKLSNQHQGHDVILEEINKSLKSLIPPIPSQRHWEIAARNCTNYISESRRFQVQIRKSQFVNPNIDNRIFHNMSGEWMLSEEMKRFSEIACSKRIEFINAKLIKKISLGVWHPIPITCEEADLQKIDSSLTRPQILSIINSLIPFLDDVDRSHFQ